MAASAQPIVRGDAAGAYLALTEQQRRAVVRLVPAITGADEVACTGLLVKQDLVVTAKHCVEGVAAADVAVQVASGAEISTAFVSSVSLHPELDLAALVLEPGFAKTEASPIAPLLELRGDWVGRRAVLAGHGDDGASEYSLRFATEVIGSVETTSLTMRGHGVSGACAGDSGGPLLARGEDGSVVALGTLSAGSPSCVGSDQYVRLDRASAWLLELGLDIRPANDCGALTSAGRCFDGTAVWCEASELRSARCTDTQRCGWDEGIRGFRCVGDSAACAGADTFGACDGGRALWCSAEGVAESQDCGDCGRCNYDSITGRAGCSP